MKKEVAVCLCVSVISVAIAVASLLISTSKFASQNVRITEAEVTINKLKTVAKAHSESLDIHDEFVQDLLARRINESVKKAEPIMDRFEAGLRDSQQ